MSRILIIEDEEAIADLEKDYLELSGFEVEIENRGDTGLVRAMNPPAAAVAHLTGVQKRGCREIDSSTQRQV